MNYSKIVPFTNAIPVVNFKAAAGDFSGFQNIEEFEWAIHPEPYTPRPGYFICQVTGESMNKKIPNGSWCLFKTDSGGTREGKTVLVQHVKIQDNEFGGKYTVKRSQYQRANRRWMEP
jgi:phage repressor protein C with HTH and peptisase S24 domain